MRQIAHISHLGLGLMPKPSTVVALLHMYTN